MKTVFFSLTILLASLSYASKSEDCSVDQMIEAPEIDGVPVRDLKSSTKYIKIDTGHGRCAAILKPLDEVYASDSSSDFFDPIVDLAPRTFSMKTYGQEYCVENGSVFEILTSSQTMKTAYLELKRVDQPQSETLKFSTYYESSLASAKKSNGLRALKCD